MAETFQKKIGKILAISRDLSFSHSKKFLLNFSWTQALLLGNMLKVIVFNGKFNKITPFRNNEKCFIYCKQLANQQAREYLCDPNVLYKVKKL